MGAVSPFVLREEKKENPPMYFDRPSLKAEARQIIRSARPRPVLITFLYLLLTSGLSTLVSLIISHPFDVIASLTQQGLTPDRAMLVMLSDIGPVGLFLHILLAVFGLVLSFGYSRWALTASRGEQAAISDLVSGFSMVGKVLGLALLLAVYYLGWGIFIFMAVQLLLLLVIWIPFLNLPAIFVVVFGALAFYLTRVLRYSMAVYCLLDDPEAGVFHAVRRSVRLMQGQVGNFFFLQLSFLGWQLLSGLLGGMAAAAAITIPMGGSIVGGILLLASIPLDLWLMAYTTLTYCRFYDQLPRTQANDIPFDL